MNENQAAQNEELAHPPSLPSLEELVDSPTTDELCAAIRELMSRTHKRFKQDLIGENDELLERNLRQYSARVSRNSWKACQKWCKWDDDGPVLMPDYTRMYYGKGATEVIVQEFPPQMRLMKFKGKLCMRNDSESDLEAGVGNNDYSFSLALPYTVFVFKFRNGDFSQVQCAFSDRPLRKLEEQPLVPYLSNIDSTLKVCLGGGFDGENLETGNLVQQCSYVLDHFWHSIYTDEWSGHFWDNKRHFLDSDPRMAGMAAWEEASTENPLFVVEDVDWIGHKEESFGDMVVRLFDDDRENTGLQQELYTGITDEFLDEIKSTLEQNLTRVEERLSSNVEDFIAQQLNDILNQQQGS